MNPKYFLALNLVDLGSQRELQWRVQNGVDCHPGHQACSTPLAQIPHWRAILTSNHLFSLNFNSYHRLEVLS
jgi:hypothetical protein